MKKLIFTLLFTCAFITSKANNISVSNISLENLDEANNWVNVEFDLTWENSWRISVGPSNYDAAWVFIKYRVNGGNWTHSFISQTGSTIPSGNTLEVTSDNIGAFIYRDADGSGAMNLQDIQIRWNYGAAMPAITTSDIIDVQVYAIEMVYIPEGAFAVGGTSGTERNKFHEGGGDTTVSYQIASEDAITISDTAGNLFYTAGGGINSHPGDQTGTLSSEFPKGFKAFYTMKYEVSEGQWIGFFNTLTLTQKNNRDVTDIDHKNSTDEVARNTFFWFNDGVTNSNATSDAPDRAMSFINASDINAYYDWSGLRPMTELEFEKMCRGPLAPKSGEYAWGNDNVNNISYLISNSGQSNEMLTNLPENTGNAFYTSTNGTIQGPVRNGIFASSAINKSRIETGGSYYGVMELSGNLSERCITVGTAIGRGFFGAHGDGLIDSNGDATLANYPLSTGDGYSYRGGSWFNSSAYIRVSDRWRGAQIVTGATINRGFRAVRTAQ